MPVKRGMVQNIKWTHGLDSQMDSDVSSGFSVGRMPLPRITFFNAVLILMRKCSRRIS